MTFDHIQITSRTFESYSLSLFRFQAENIPVYKRFLYHLGVNPAEINSIEKIPFLPIEFFKTETIYCGSEPPQKVFLSSSTTNTGQSRHYVENPEYYIKTFMESFRLFYGDPKQYCFLCLLPSYLEREGSSLIFMAEHLIKTSRYAQSGFYLYNHIDLYQQLLENERQNIPTILFGVSFALLDFAEQFPIKLHSTIVMETGGMKGRKQEMPREQLHDILKKAFGVDAIHSEYGMTELLSQAYSKANGIFKTPNWIKIMIYDLYNPLKTKPSGRGGINIIDLANQQSCAFIQTADVGTVFADGSFEIIGRIDYSETRGCNLLIND
ncbi:MAG TPA: acyltransferase [Salinivirgaceae bacterium]|nr:acyltransferase [Salinivirgaceae bacterium]